MVYKYNERNWCCSNFMRSDKICTTSILNVSSKNWLCIIELIVFGILIGYYCCAPVVYLYWICLCETDSFGKTLICCWHCSIILILRVAIDSDRRRRLKSSPEQERFQKTSINLKQKILMLSMRWVWELFSSKFATDLCARDSHCCVFTPLFYAFSEFRASPKQ